MKGKDLYPQQERLCKETMLQAKQMMYCRFQVAATLVLFVMAFTSLLLAAEDNLAMPANIDDGAHRAQ